jgi:hypothetical protein
MTLRVRRRGVQTALHWRSSGGLRRAPPYEPNTFGDGSRGARSRCGYALGEINEALRQGSSVLELRQACNTLFLHKIGDSTRISCTF